MCSFIKPIFLYFNYELDEYWKQYENKINFYFFDNIKAFEWININHFNKLSTNPSNWVYNILKNNLDKISWILFNNPYIFTFDKLVYNIN